MADTAGEATVDLLGKVLRLAGRHAATDGSAIEEDRELRLCLAEMSIADVVDVVDTLKVKDGETRSITLYRCWIAQSEHKPRQLYPAWYNLGVQFVAAEATSDARAAFETALALKPDLAAAAINAGLCREELGDVKGALGVWGKALQSDGDRIALLNHRGRLLEKFKHFDEAERAFEASLLTDPTQTDVIHHWIGVKTKACSWPLFKGLPGLDCDAVLASTGALSLLALTDDPALQDRANAAWIARKMAPCGRSRMSPPLGYAHRKLRIGYMSSDFCLHPMAYLVADLFEQHDRDAFTIYGYCSTKDDGSDVRRRVLASFDHVTFILGMTDEEAARAIRADEIDILVDLNGMTLGTRLPVLQWRPAPVQVTYLGYNGPVPLPELDYIIADRYVIPPSTAARHRPPPLYLPSCYQANDRYLPVASGETRAAAGLPKDGFVFCCFSNSYKITEDMFEAWVTILRRTENTILWLYADSEAAQRNMTRSFVGAGLCEDRLVFAARNRPDVYRARLALADLFLDTFPYNAGTTASDALRVGLPVVTLAGRTFISRMAGSLLRAIGLEEGVVHTRDAYIELAVDLASDPARYRIFREALSGDAWTRTLGDTPTFTQNFEAALKNVAILASTTNLSLGKEAA
jgi:predicted O-linked N-acetylglucosamine transferase (SPINDLY family)